MSTIKENTLASVTSLVDADELRVLTSAGASRVITVENFKTSVVPEPLEVSLTLSGATTIDLSLYKRHVNFKLTITANSTFVFTNMEAGQTGYITLVDDGVPAYGYTLSYSGDYEGSPIYAPPRSGAITSHIFKLSAVGTAGAVIPIFDLKSTAKAPIVLNCSGVLATSNTLFKDSNRFTYHYHGSDLVVEEVWGVTSIADTGATQPTFGMFIEGRTIASATSLSATDNTEVQVTITGDNLDIDDGDYIEVLFTQGTNADAEDLTVYIVCREKGG